MKVEHITYNPDTTDFDVDREAIISKYGIGKDFAAGNVVLYELGLITLGDLKSRSSYPKGDPEHYKTGWPTDVHNWAVNQGWDVLKSTREGTCVWVK